MKRFLKLILPPRLIQRLRGLNKAVKYKYRFLKILFDVTQGKVDNVILGAAETYQVGWHATNQQWLDITKRNDWDKIFSVKGSIKRIVAEHVFEHLTEKQTQIALDLIFQNLTAGGRVRIAVPDGYNPDQDYLRHVGIAGIGPDAADHKQLLNRTSLQKLMSEAGFSTTLIEGYSKNGKLTSLDYDPKDGFILRSRRNPNRISAEGWEFKDAQTSLIVDGVKPSKRSQCH